MYIQVIKFRLQGLCGKHLYMICLLSYRPQLVKIFFISSGLSSPELSILLMIIYEFSNVCLQNFSKYLQTANKYLRTIWSGLVIATAPLQASVFFMGYLTIQDEDPIALGLETQWDFLLLGLPCLLA